MISITRRFVLSLIAFILLSSQSAFASQDIDGQIQAKSAILIDAKSGRTLYERNANERMYPASLTKMLTALVALDYLSPEDAIVAGPEVNSVPYDSSKAGHSQGETLLVENLIRGLIIPSGNETACVVANAVARRVQGGTVMTYSQMEKLFCGLMDKKAKDLGANNSNFVNPHGYHNPDHFTTAADMALIARGAMQNQLIASIAGEKEFIGNGAGSLPDPLLKTRLYEWRTHNELIAPGDYFYPYATGIKTGYTGEAGDCLAASAEKDDISLIAILLDSEDPGRWTDGAALFDYGFDTFAYRTVQQPGEINETARVANVRLGDGNQLNVVASGSFEYLLSAEELARVSREILYDGLYIAPQDVLEKEAQEREKRDEPPYPTDDVTLMAPISKNTVVGQVTYSLDGNVIFTDKLVAATDIRERTPESDREYYWNEFKQSMFSVQALPYWAAAVGAVLLIVFIIRFIIKRRARRNRNVYRTRKWR